MPTAKFMGRLRIPMYLAPTTLSEDLFNAAVIFPRQFGDNVIGFKESNVYSYALRGTGLSQFKAFRLHTNNAATFTNVAAGQTGTTINGAVGVAQVNNRFNIIGASSGTVSMLNRPRICSTSWAFNYSPNFQWATLKETSGIGALSTLQPINVGLTTAGGSFGSCKIKLQDASLFSYTSVAQFYVTGAGSFIGYAYLNANGEPTVGGALFQTSRLFLSVPQRIFWIPTPQSGFKVFGTTPQIFSPGYNYFLSRGAGGNPNWAHGLVHVGGANNPGFDTVTSLISPSEARFENAAWTTYFNSAGAVGSGFEVACSDTGAIFIRLAAATSANYVNRTNMLLVSGDWSQYWEIELIAVETLGGFILDTSSPQGYRVSMDRDGYLYAYKTTTVGQPLGYNAARQYLTSYSLNIPFDPQFLTQDLVNNLTPMNGVNCLLQCTNPVLL